MAAPTPTTYTEWNGVRGMTYWNAVWTTTDNITDGVVVDISTLTGAGNTSAPSVVKVTGVKCQTNGDVAVTLEFDATTDQLIYRFQNQTDSTAIDVADFREGPSGGRTPTSTAAGFVGDILATTANVASGDEVTILVFYERKS